jgi:uncharacterized membrane protein
MGATLTLFHVVFGSAALLAAPAALLVRTGGAKHKWFGTAFTIVMAVVLFTAAFLWQAKGHAFLVPLAIVSAYLIFNGWRVIARRRRKIFSPLQIGIDAAAALGVMIAGAVTAWMGWTAHTPLMHSIAPALFGIGGIAIAFGINDLLGFAAPRLKIGWLLSHFSAMLASYISAVTAFVVINAHAVPMMLRWGVPGTIGALTITIYSLQTIYRGSRRPNRGASPVRVVPTVRGVAPVHIRPAAVVTTTPSANRQAVS